MRALGKGGCCLKTRVVFVRLRLRQITYEYDQSYYGGQGGYFTKARRQEGGALKGYPMGLSRQSFVQPGLETVGRLVPAPVQAEEVFRLEQALHMTRECGVHPHVVLKRMARGRVDRAVDILA
jgi:hypothetical protein